MAETEVILLRRFAAGHDAAAFAEITRRHAGLVYGAAWRILSDMDLAADVAQDTFLQLTKDAGTITGSLPGWLHRVATHKAIDRRRRDMSRRQREADYVEHQVREARDWKDISPHVDEGLRALDPELREMVVAHFLDGQTTREIADVHGVSQATVSRRIDAGVNQLRAILRKRGVIVAVGALGTLLGENAAQGAPAAVMTELGKMALVGGHSAIASAGIAQTLSSLFSTATSTAVATVKANAIAVAAVAAIGAGSVVTYKYASGTKKESPAVSVSAPAPVNRSQGPMTVVATRPSAQTPPMMGALPSAWTAASLAPQTTVQDEKPVASTPSSEQVAVTPDSKSSTPAGRAFGSMGIGGYGMGGGPAVVSGSKAAPPDPNQPSSSYGYSSYSGAPPGPRVDPNDPHDSNDSSDSADGSSGKP